MVYRNGAAMAFRHLIGKIFRDVRCGFIKDGDRLGIHKVPRFVLLFRLGPFPFAYSIKNDEPFKSYIRANNAGGKSALDPWSIFIHVFIAILF